MANKVPANPIPEKQYERFKNKLEEYSSRNSERNTMLFTLAVATGFRMQDLVDLTIAQIKEALEDEEFYIQEKKQYNTWLKYIQENPNSKKKKPEKRRAPIRNNLKKLLKDYIKGKKKSEYAFPSQKGNGNEHIKEKSFSLILSKVGKELGLKHISGHSLRKTYAHRNYRRTNNLEHVRRALNHKSIEVTKLYLGVYEIALNDAADIADEYI